MRVGHGRRGRAGRGLGPSELVERELALERREARLCIVDPLYAIAAAVRGRRHARGGRTWAARPSARPRRRGSRRPTRRPTRPGFDQKSRRACLSAKRGRAFEGFFGASRPRSPAARPGAAASGGRRHYQNRSRRRLLSLSARCGFRRRRRRNFSPRTTFSPRNPRLWEARRMRRGPRGLPTNSRSS